MPGPKPMGDDAYSETCRQLGITKAELARRLGLKSAGALDKRVRRTGGGAMKAEHVFALAAIRLEDERTTL